MLKITRKQILLSGVSIAALSSLSATAAYATGGTDVYTTNTESLSTPGDTSSNLLATTVVTFDDNDYGAYMTGSGHATYTWNVNANLENDENDNDGFRVDTSAGTEIININGHYVVGNSLSAGMNISTSGTSHAIVTVNSGSIIQGGSSLGSGIYVNSTSSNATTINVENGASVIDGSGAAGIHMSSSAASSTIDNAGTISGFLWGHGIELDADALVNSITNESTGTITGGAAFGNGLDIQSYNGASGAYGINLIDNKGIITGSGCFGNGIAIYGSANVGTIHNETGGMIVGGGTICQSHGITMYDQASVATITNDTGGLIAGGNTISGGYGIQVSGSSHVGTINNSGTIIGGECGGHGIRIREDGYIGTINNYSGGFIGTSDNAWGYGILVTGEDADDGFLGATAYVGTIYNSGTISGGYSGTDAAIGLFGGDYTHASTTALITNADSGVIKGNSGGYGIQVGDYTTVTELDNYGQISGNGTSGRGISINGNANITTLNNGSSEDYSHAVIAGSNTSSGGIGIYISGAGSITTLTNYGYIASGLPNGGDFTGDRYGTGISVVGSGSIGTIVNNGSIQGGYCNGTGINVAGSASITTITNNDGAFIGAGFCGGNGIGISVAGTATIGTIENYGYIEGGYSGGTGISVSNTASITTINNYSTGYIDGGYCGGVGIAVANNAHIGTINNYGNICGGTGIDITGSGSIHTINNYSTGWISGYEGTAIQLGSAGAGGSSGTGVTINTAGEINGDIRMGYTDNMGGDHTGDVINIYGGEIDGDIYGVSGEGNYGTVNFNLVGGTFGIDGASVDGTFSTDGNIGGSGAVLYAVNVNSGIVTLNDDIYANTTTIANGATLIANNTGQSISNDLVNSGTLDLKENTLIVGGNISGSGILAFQVSPTVEGVGTHGNITSNVDSTATMATMYITPYYANGDVTSGEKLVVVNSPGTLTYTPDYIFSSGGIKWTLSEAGSGGTDSQGYSYGGGSLLATASSITAGVAAPNASSVNALSDYSGSDPTILALKAGLNNFTDNSAAGAQLRPDANGGGIEGALGAIGLARDTIIDHLNNEHGGSGAASGEMPKGVGFWAQGFGTFQNQGTESGVNGFNADTYGGTFGADKAIHDNLRVGAAFSYANTKVDDKGDRAGSGETVDSYIGNIYGTYRAAKWYVDGTVTVADHEYNSTRLVDFISPALLASGSFSAQQYGAKLEAGYPVAVDKATVTPFASFAYDRFNQQGYTETGAGSDDNIVQGSDTNSEIGGLGVKVSTLCPLTDGWTFKPTAHLGWSYEFNSNLIPDQNVELAGGGVSFTTPGLKLSQNAVDFGVGFDLLSEKNLTLSAKYDGELRSDYMSNTGLLKVRIDF